MARLKRVRRRLRTRNATKNVVIQPVRPFRNFRSEKPIAIHRHAAQAGINPHQASALGILQTGFHGMATSKTVAGPARDTREARVEDTQVAHKEARLVGAFSPLDESFSPQLPINEAKTAKGMLMARADS